MIGVILFTLPHVPDTRARQDDAQCASIVQRALEVTELRCESTGRNEACYGHAQLDAQPQPFVTDWKFDAEGDIAVVTDLLSLRLSRVDVAKEEWGVALFRLQANISDTAPEDQNVTLVMFGDTSIENRTSPSLTLPAVVPGPRTINIRYRPQANARILGTASPDTAVTVTGRLADGSWLRVRHPVTGGTGWMRADLLSSDQDLSALPVVQPEEKYYGPMQAFYFQSASGADTCQEAPNGLVLQTPEGNAEISFLINEVDIQLGSTVWTRALPGEDMTIAVLEGAAEVTAFGRRVSLPAGTELSLPLDENLGASGPPGDPRPYDPSLTGFLPVNLLPVVIDVADPLTVEEVQELPPAELVEEPPVVEEESEGDAGPVLAPATPTWTPTRRPTRTSTPTDVPTDTPIPTDTPTDTPTHTPTPTDTEVPTNTPEPTDTPDDCLPDEWQNLQLRHLCSPDPDSYRVWEVTNLNGANTDFTWEVISTGQSGAGSVPGATCDGPGVTTFTTVTEHSSNQTRILVAGDEQDRRHSTDEQCP